MVPWEVFCFYVKRASDPIVLAGGIGNVENPLKIETGSCSLNYIFSFVLSLLKFALFSIENCFPSQLSLFSTKNYLLLATENYSRSFNRWFISAMGTPWEKMFLKFLSYTVWEKTASPLPWDHDLICIFHLFLVVIFMHTEFLFWKSAFMWSVNLAGWFEL